MPRAMHIGLHLYIEFIPVKRLDPPPFTYEGKTYTAYEAQQQMRKMERAMRKQKDRCIVADAAGDKESFTTASIRLNRQKYVYEDFCKAAGTYTEYERTFVAGYNRRLAGKTGAVTRKQRAFDKAQLRLTDGGNGGIIQSDTKLSELGKFKERMRLDDRVSDEYYQAAKSKFSHGTDNAKAVFNKYVPADSVADSEYVGVSHYNPTDKKIYMDYASDLNNERGACATWFHEHGHLIDDMAGRISDNADFRKALDDDYLSYMKVFGNKNGLKTFDKVQSAIGKNFYP